MKKEDVCKEKTSRSLLTETLPAVVDDVDLSNVRTKDIERIMRELTRILPLKGYVGHSAEELVFRDAKTRVANMDLTSLVVGNVYTLEELLTEVGDIPGICGYTTSPNSKKAIKWRLATRGVILEETGNSDEYFVKHICSQNTKFPNQGDIPCELIMEEIGDPVKAILHFIATHIDGKYGLEFSFRMKDFINYLDGGKVLLPLKNACNETYGSVFKRDISSFIDDIFTDTGLNKLASRGIIKLPQNSNYKYHYPLRLVVVELIKKDSNGDCKRIFHRDDEMAKIANALFGEKLEEKRSNGSSLHIDDRMKAFTQAVIRPYRLIGSSQATNTESMAGYFSNVEECYFERVVELNPCIHYPRLSENEQSEIAYRIHLDIIDRLETKYESYSSGKSKKPAKEELEAYPKLIQVYKDLVEKAYGYRISG